MTEWRILAVAAVAVGLGLQSAAAQSPREGGKRELSSQPYRAPETAVPRSLSFWPFAKWDEEKKTCDPAEPEDATTAGEARQRIAQAGFENARELKKGCDNVWRGIATQDGRDVQLEVGPQGDVVVQ